MKAKTIRTIPQRTQNIFTDREEPRQAFWNVYQRVRLEPGSVEAISFYGVGGIGKSSLLIQLIKELKERALTSPLVFYNFELSGKSKDYFLYFLAENLMQQCSSLQFPLFSTALSHLYKMAGRDVSELEKKMENSILNSSKMNVAMEVMNAIIPNFGVAKLAGEASLKFFKKMKTDLDHQSGKNAAFYQEIESSSAAELMNNLHNYFCLDLADYLETLTSPIVFLLDGYEVLTNTLERGELAEIEDTWLWGLEGTIWSLPNTVWVIAGRNRLTWDRYSEEIKESLEQHLLSSLSEKDTIEYLQLSGVKEPNLYAELHRLTGGTPVYLDMCINTYLQIKANQGENYTPTIEDFGNNPTAIVERFLRGMNSEHQRSIKLLACLPTKWNEDFAMEVSQKAGYTNMRGPLEDICKLSLVEETGDCKMLQRTLRNVIRKFMSDDERNRLDTVAFDTLLQRMEDFSLKSSHEVFADWTIDLLSQEDCSIKATKEQLRTLFTAASTCNELGKYHAFKYYVQQISYYILKQCLDESCIALCCVNQYLAYSNLGRYQISKEFAQEAYDIYLKLYGPSHPDTLDILNKKAWCYSRLGDWQKALELTETVYQERLKLYGSNHKDTVACLNNMAIYCVMKEDFKMAAEYMKQASESMLVLLGPDHPNTIICQNNLAAVYNKLGEPQKATEILQQVYETQLRTLGDTHPDILFSLFNLSIGYSDSGNHEKALEYAIKAYEAHTKILDDEHPDTMSALNNLAECHYKSGNYEEANRFANLAYNQRLAVLGKDHKDTVETKELLDKIEKEM